MKIPNPMTHIPDLINQYHEDKKDLPRPHFGLSQAGHHCDRWLWLSFRWAVIPKFPGRIKRLFRRGHYEEYIIVEDLKAIGMNIIHTGEDDQKRVIASKFVSGSLDGIILSGVPEALNTEHVLEMKTHNKKSFDELEKSGVEKAKFIHFIQMQCYMRLERIERALYVAVCKDDDRLYTERIRLDKKIADTYITRCINLSRAERIPPRYTDDSSFYKCKMCAAHDFCFGSKLTKEVNCRTCCHSTPDEEKGFTCARWDNMAIPEKNQIEGCPSHVFHLDLVPWGFVEGFGNWSAEFLINNKKVVNGEDGMKSSEILKIMQNGGKLTDNLKAVIDTFNAEVIDSKEIVKGEVENFVKECNNNFPIF